MAKLTFDISDKLDEEFRKTIGLKNGIKKGVLGDALEEALEDWIKKTKIEVFKNYKATTGEKS